MNASKISRSALAIAFAWALGGSAQAQIVINDTLTGTTSAYDWKPLNGACLTAGDGSASKIPACRVAGKNLPYYGTTTLVGGDKGTLPDAVNFGALRLTNGDTTTGGNGNNQTGAVVSNFTFPTNEGLQVTWTSVTYGGNAYNNGSGGSGALSGADGISFFLSDGGTPASPVPPTVGALGGSLGYSCSNGNGTYDGVVGGYLGIGMDEFGNFSNATDNTNTGAPGGGKRPGAIVVRGAGHTAWSWLTAHYPTYYPSTTSTANQMAAVHNTCRTGYLYNYSGTSLTVPVPTYYTADYTYTTCSRRSCSDSTGSITSASPIPSTSSCDSSGNPISSGGRICTYSSFSSGNTRTVANGGQLPATSAYKLDYNYPYLTGSNFPAGTYIYNQEALGKNSDGSSVAIRGNATPITYALTITQAGVLTLTYSINGGTPFTVLNNFDIKASNGPIPASFRFGFSAGTGGGSNVHEITCFKAAPANYSNSSAGTNVQSGRVQTDSQVYLAYYHPINSWGSLTAQDLVFTPGTSSTAATLTVSPTVNWDGGCTLTGGPCLSKDNATITAPLTDTTRTILSWDGTEGIPFQWGNLTTGQQTALTSGDTTITTDRLDYLRGSRAKEVASSGPFRDRTSLLGDIVDSSPVWVGPPNLPYAVAWADKLHPSSSMPEGSSYGSYVSDKADRINVVYAGSNDGMVHGFRAGKYSDGTLDKTTNDGREVLAYVPSQVVSTIHSANTALDFSNTSYSHNFFVDATPGQGDLYYGGAWHTWLVGGLGPGGQAKPIADAITTGTGTVFALDVTDPSKFAESAATSIVKAEWSSVSLQPSTGAYTCTGGGSSCGDHLGQTYGTPLIRRLHDGTWGVIFGNGLNSKSGTAGIFIAHISPVDGSTTEVQFIDTKAIGPTTVAADGTSSTVLNGIVQTTAVDLDGDHVADYVYAGDVLGNVWRFDLTGSSSGSWSVGSAIFKTQTGQPITSGIAVDAVTTTNEDGSASTAPLIVLAFGTGQKYPRTLTQDSSYPTTQQSIYGIWDADMTAWNGMSSTQYASLTSLVKPVAGSAGNLLQQALTSSGSSRSANVTTTVCWQGTSACKSPKTNNQMGWEVDLSVTPASGSTPAVAEQVLFNPLIVQDVFNTNTSVPTIAQALTCDSSSEKAFSFGLSMATGGALPAPVPAPPGSSGSYFAGATVGTVAIATQATGTSSYVQTSDGSKWLVFQKNDGTGGTQQIFPLGSGPSTGVGSRLTWTKQR